MEPECSLSHSKAPATCPYPEPYQSIGSGPRFSLYGCLQRVTIPEAVVIQLILLIMSSVLLETCWGV